MNRPVSDTEYTGLTDSAIGFTGSSTLDSAVDPGSPLPLVVDSNRNQGIDSPHNQFHTSTYDLWDMVDPEASLRLSGVSDPPFASAGYSTPYPYARQPRGSLFNAITSQSKFGSGISTLLGAHPETVSAVPSELHGARVGITTRAHIPSGHFTAAIVTVVVAGILLLLWSGGGEL